MCTVTLVPTGKNDFILTSNRDEAPNRVSLSPEIYALNNFKLLFPKDEVSGGTWIGVSEKKRVVCVLNGAFTRHQRQSFYRRSRGLVATDFLLFDNLNDQLKVYNFQGIEPFTIIIADWNHDLKFFELVWDGETVFYKVLPLKEYLWSSTTLYTPEMKKERQFWFQEFKNRHNLNTENLLKFHKSAGYGNSEYGVVMDRGFVKTTSITQIEKNNDVVKMNYENLINASNSNKTIKFHATVNE